MKTYKYISFLLLMGCAFAQVNSVDSVNSIIKHALWQTQVTKIYDPSYVKMKYPNGDIPIERGVCCDVVIRAFRAVGIDFQKEIHLDMKNSFDAYPKIWGLKSPDPNIDHRRVPNIMTFLERNKKSLSVTSKASEYKPGDIVTWKIPGNLDHIGLVSNVKVKNSDRFQIIHNIGYGAVLEDVLFEFTITGHYRYFSNN